MNDIMIIEKRIFNTSEYSCNNTPTDQYLEEEDIHEALAYAASRVGEDQKGKGQI